MKLYDVLAITIKSPSKVRFLAQGETEENAEAIQNMAIIRRGVETEFYSVVTHGIYKEGQLWRGVK